MAWTLRFLACFVAATVGGAELAVAETGNFNAPSVRGVRLDYCRHFGSECGKPAADLFCRENGFAEAVRFLIDENVGGRGIQTLVFGDGRTCDGQGCSGFRTITCSRPDQQAAPIVAPPAIALAPLQPLPAPPAATMVAPLPELPPPALAVKPLLPLPPAIGATPPTTLPPPAIALRPITPLPAPPVLSTKPPVLAPLPRKNPEGSVAILTLPKSPPGSAAPSGGPLFALPAGASLVRCTSSSCEFAVTHDFDIDPRDADQSEHFIGRVDKIDLANGFRWQVTTMPFPAFQSGSAADLDPPGLAASGDFAGKEKGFDVDFKKIVGDLEGRSAPPPSLYIRILPLASASSPVVVGQPSNAMRVYYGSEPPPQAPITIYESTPPKLFTVKVVAFTPATFEKPGRWGCVTITGHKGQVVSPWSEIYPIGKELCPKSFKGGGYQITSFGEFVDWATGGVADAVDWVSDRYEDMKQLAVDIVMKYTPFGQQCELIGKMIDDGAPGYCELAANVAVNAGLAALGMPPSIPNYNELIDKGVDHAVELAAAEIYAQTGVPCIGPCEDALREGFGEAAEELKKASYTPGCVGENEAHQHGREPLCLPDFIIARPALGAVYTPPVADVEITRNFADKNPTSIYKGGCSLSVGIRFDNHFSGGTVWGPGTKTMEVPAQDVSGYLYQGEGADIAEAMPKGSKKTMSFIFNAPQEFLFPWTKKLWQQSQIPPQSFMGGDWSALYAGAWANVSAGLNCAQDQHVLAYKLPGF
jgi:hypothetical protein